VLASLQDPDIKLLRMFYVIAKCGGFSAAQAQLNLSQSAISSQMAQLEARLGVRLCDRGRGNFKLTDHGAAVITAAEKLFSALDDFRADVNESQGRLSGELKLGLIDNCVTHDNSLIRDAISRFVAVATDVRISIFVGGAIDLEQQVIDGRLHLAIGLFHHELESLDYSPLMDEEHGLYCASAHPFFEKDDSELNELALRKARYVSWGYGEGLPGWRPPFEFNEVASSPYIEGVAYLVLSGAYVGYLPTHYAEFWVAQRRLRQILPEQTRRSIKMSLVKRRSVRMSRLMKTFLDELLPAHQ
jgi:LysR family transcriptional regulator, transcriptional activator for bauABCD operon